MNGLKNLLKLIFKFKKFTNVYVILTMNQMTAYDMKGATCSEQLRLQMIFSRPVSHTQEK